MPRHALASLIALTLSTAAFADETRPAELQKVQVTGQRIALDAWTVDTTSAATPLALSLRDTPQSVTVFTRERLEDRNLVSMRDVLDDTPGVYSYAWDTERVNFTSRGFDVDNLLYDGVPAVTNFSTDSVDDTIDMAAYERIEIVRGATGLMSGTGSPAASVNLVRKHAASREFEAELGVSSGSWDDRRVEADVSMPLTTDGRVRARLAGAWQERGSYQDLYGLDKLALYGIVDADLGERTTASLGFDYTDNDARGNTWGSFPLFLADGTPADWPRSVTTATDWSFWDRRTKSVFGEVAHAFENGWSLRGTASWRRFDEDMALFYMYGFPDPVDGSGLEPFAYRSRGDVTQESLGLQASGPFTLFDREHEAVVGFNASRSNYGGSEYQPGAYADTGNFFEWDGSYPEPSFAEDPTPLTDIDVRQDELYAAARIVLAQPLKLVTGARVTRFETDYFYLYDTPGDGFDYDFTEIIPYAGLVWDFSRDFSGFTSYTRIFKPQNTKDAAGHFLDPIDGESFEAGLKGEHFGGRLNTSLTVFETRQDNVATPVFDPETGEPVLLPDGTLVSDGIDGTRTRGYELELSGALAPGWNASLGWTHYRIEDADGAAIRTFIPGTLVRAFTAWTLPALDGRLTLGAGVNWQSDSHTFVGSPDGGTDLRQDAVPLVGLMARWRFSDAASLAAERRQPAGREVLRARRVRQHLLRRAAERRSDPAPRVLAARTRAC
jgi:outer membrane receptor for ferric coprogen and ferric-rhodotorulic acid